MRLLPFANPIKNRARPYFGGFPLRELGGGRHTAVYLMGGWLVPSPSIGVVGAQHVGEPIWSADPTDPHDAGHAVVGARSGMMVPLHDQQMGPLGIDSRDWAGEPIQVREPVDSGEDDWP